MKTFLAPMAAALLLAGAALAAGARLDKVDTPFSVAADTPFAAALTKLLVVGGAASGKEAIHCGDAP